MNACRPWLPAAAIEAGTRDVPLRRVVSDWSAKWFATAPATLTGDAVATAVLDRQGGGSWELADGLAVMLAADTEPALIACLFGVHHDAGPLTTADRAAFAAVVDACLADLRARLAMAFRLPADAPWRPASAEGDATRWWVWRLSVGRGTALLRIATAEALIIRRIRAGLPPEVRRGALTPLAVALADQTIALSALVGRCRLTAAELGGLETGDVIVLDRMVGDTVALAVDCDPTPSSCTVGERDGRLNLTLADLWIE